MKRLLTKSVLYLASLFVVAQAQAQVCGTPGQDGNLTVNTANQIVNTYYTGVDGVTAGSTTIEVSDPRGASTTNDIASGDLLLVIQMQDAAINRGNSSSYGDGVSGGEVSGTTNDRTVGVYEYVVATSAIVNGEVSIQGEGNGNGLVYRYRDQDANNNRGQRRFQVIRIPQYSNLTLGSGGTLTAAPWNGASGGIVVVDVDNAITFSGGSIDVTGRGFRGGGAQQLTGGSNGSDTDYRNLSTRGFHGSKGEGIVGTPRYVHNAFGGGASGTIVDTGDEGYPNGSFGHGAPGNAGGGGTDGRISANDQNSGGGGGGNAGRGGRGGLTWSSEDDTGGYGGAPFGSASILKLIMGGGGGAATRNDSVTPVQSSGGAGGGIIMVRAGSVSGTGSMIADGISPSPANGLFPENDGGGGGGAGGTIVFLAVSGQLDNVTISADGGDGCDVDIIYSPHGPGGGGGGGIVYIHEPVSLGTVTVNGGENGEMTNGNAFGATSGTDGVIVSNLTNTNFRGCGTVPITLAGFQATRGSYTTTFRWHTATETANTGFHLYAMRDGEWVQINDDLIPSKVFDSLEPQVYRYSARVPASDKAFSLADVDAFGQKTWHGPFQLGETYGENVYPELISWAASHQELASMPNLSGSPYRDASAGLALNVSEAGIHRLTFEHMAFIGFPIGTKPARDLALTNEGQSVPLYIDLGQTPDGITMGSGGYIDFIAQPAETLYSRIDQYQLTFAPGSARPMRVWQNRVDESGLDAGYYEHTAQLAENRIYSFASPLEDPWFMERLLTIGAPKSFDFDIETNHMLGGSPAQLKVSLYGGTNYPQDPEHHAILHFNGQKVADVTFDGLEHRLIEVDLENGLVRQGNNTLTIELPADMGAPAELIQLESIALTYPRQLQAIDGTLAFNARGRLFRAGGFDSDQIIIYSTSSYGHGTRIQSFNALVDGFGKTNITFNGTSGQADYWIAEERKLFAPGVEPIRQTGHLLEGNADFLIISHPLFMQGIERLSKARTRQGYRVKTVDAFDIYARYNHGRVHPRAIRDYIREAHQHLGVAYVLLVGGDSYDYKNHVSNNAISFIPTLYTATHQVVHHTPADALLTDLDDDNVPDLPIGRFPVRNLTELETIIGKTLAFQARPRTASALFAAGKPDPGISYASDSEGFIQDLPDHWSAERAYLEQLGQEATRHEIIDSINQGVSIVNFFGHSSTNVWTGDRIFTADDAAQVLTNETTPTVVLQWGCWNSYHVYPKYNTMAHNLLLKGNFGAAAVIGSSTLTQAESDQKLAPLLLKNLFSQRLNIGDALTAAKQELAQGNATRYLDVLLGITILGDPTLTIEP